MTDKLTAIGILRMAEALRIKVVIPIHHDIWASFLADVKEITTLWNMNIVELFGAISYDVEQKYMMSVGKDVADKLNSSLFPLSVLIYIKGTLAGNVIVETPLIKRTLEKIEKCDFILTGIGVVEGNFGRHCGIIMWI